MKFRLWQQPIRIIATIFWWTKYMVQLRVGRSKRLNAFDMQCAANLYSNEEISGGKFRELARAWALGDDIGPELDALIKDILNADEVDQSST